MKIIPVIVFASSMFLFSCGGKSYCECKKEMEQLDKEFKESGGSQELAQKMTDLHVECNKEMETASNREKAECIE